MAFRDRWQMEPWDGRPARPVRLPRSRPPSFPRPNRLEIGPGLIWPAVSGVAVVAAIVLAWIALDLGGIGGLVFPVGFGAICVVAVCAVRRDQLFVPAVQSPVIATVAVVGSAVLEGKTGSSTTLLLAVLAPLAGMFWWLLATSVLCVALALARSGRLRAIAPSSR